VHWFRFSAVDLSEPLSGVGALGGGAASTESSASAQPKVQPPVAGAATASFLDAVTSTSDGSDGEDDWDRELTVAQRLEERYR